MYFAERVRLMLAFPLLFPWTPTEATRAYAQDVRQAIADDGLTEKDAASRMEIPRSLLSEWWSGAKQISGSRLAMLGETFDEKLQARRAARAGGFLLTADVVMLLKGAARLTRKMMAHATLAAGPSHHKDRRQA
jgi:hypothetical protein